jgi:hypothetical protein
MVGCVDAMQGPIRTCEYEAFDIVLTRAESVEDWGIVDDDFALLSPVECVGVRLSSCLTTDPRAQDALPALLFG